MDLPDPTLYATRKGFRYFEHYERAFASQRTDPITILEIGVQKGGCLEFWADFFVQGTIVGIDKDPVAKDFKENKRIHFFQGVQQDNHFLDEVTSQCAPDGFDIIIDDASHIAEFTSISFWHLFTNHLKPGGMYVIEDWGTGYWSKWPDGVEYQGENHTAGMVGFVKELIDDLGISQITNEQFGKGPLQTSDIESIQFFHGMVFVSKALVPAPLPS
jgi:cephalosporin hydroxylase